MFKRIKALENCAGKMVLKILDFKEQLNEFKERITQLTQDIEELEKRVDQIALQTWRPKL